MLRLTMRVRFSPNLLHYHAEHGNEQSKIQNLKSKIAYP